MRKGKLLEISTFLSKNDTRWWNQEFFCNKTCSLSFEMRQKFQFKNYSIYFSKISSVDTNLGISKVILKILQFLIQKEATFQEN